MTNCVSYLVDNMYNITSTNSGQLSITEFLNSLSPNGLPPHTHKIKQGTPLMLLRNINPREGLCNSNGTRLIFEKALNNKLLECTIMSSGRTVLLPRICFIPKAVSSKTCLRNDNKQVSRPDTEDSCSLAQISDIHPWTAICCLLQGPNTTGSQVCSVQGGKEYCTECGVP